MPDIPIAERVRMYREKRGRTQAAIAGLVGITPEYLSQIERGLKTPTIQVLHAIAQELEVPLSVLLGEPERVRDEPATRQLGEVERAFLASSRPAPGVEVSLVDLRERVEAAWRLYQTSPTRFSDTGSRLPALIVDVEVALRAFRAPGEADERREANRIAVDLYGLLRSYFKRRGRINLSWLAADRAIRSAQESEDTLRIAAAQWNLGHAFLSDHELEGAEDTVRAAAADLTGWDESPELAAMRGSLHLVAAVAQSRRRDWWGARATLDGPATAAATISGEGNVMWTVFGPANVAMHRASVEMEAGEAGEALRIADTVDPLAMVSIERRMTYLLEVSRCYEQRRDDAGVLLHLQQAELLAPEDVHTSLMVRELVRTLHRRARPSYSRQVAALAARVGLLAN